MSATSGERATVRNDHRRMEAQARAQSARDKIAAGRLRLLHVENSIGEAVRHLHVARQHFSDGEREVAYAIRAARGLTIAEPEPEAVAL